MNRHLVYEPTQLRHAERIAEVRCSRAIPSSAHRGRWRRPFARTHQRLRVAVHLLAGRTHTAEPA